MIASKTKRPSSTRFNFTKSALLAIEPPDQGKYDVRDTRIPGLILTVTSTGNRTFYLYKRIGGRPQRIRIASFDECSLEQARRQAESLNGEIARGGNPAESRRAVRGEALFSHLFERYMELHAKAHKRSWAEDQRQYDKYLTLLHSKRLSEIKQTDIAALHSRVGKKNGKYQANRVLAVLSSVFAFAERSGWQGMNPCKGITRFREQSRNRFLSRDELERFFRSLADEPNRDLKDFFLIALLSGARRANLQSMRWGDVNLDRGLWQIEAAESKNAEPMVIVLPTPAVTLLRGRRVLVDGEFVFPSRGRSGHLSEPKKAWARILERAGIENLRFHDLRRTFGSWQAHGGASLPIIGKSLGHRSVAATRVYARMDLEPVIASVNSTALAMLEAGGAELIDGARNAESEA